MTIDVESLRVVATGDSLPSSDFSASSDSKSISVILTEWLGCCAGWWCRARNEEWWWRLDREAAADLYTTSYLKVVLFSWHTQQRRSPLGRRLEMD